MRDTGFYVQMHLHTAESSRCARVGGADMARACKEAGYDLIVVTDHFFNANINVPYDIPWEEQVRGLFAGYRAAKAMGDKIGLRVLPGWETYTDGPEYLTYGLGEEFLLKNRDIALLPKVQYLRRVHEAGGYVSHAHPFREASYIPHFDPDPYGLDAVEVFNGRHMDPSFDEKARAFAKRCHLPGTAGADAHNTLHIYDGAMRFFYPVTTFDEIFAAIRKGDYEIVPHLNERATGF